MQTHCGYVALLGRPNAGKSTLLNALVGDKIAAVSRKPQTTRNRILGISIVDQTQMLFLDTPGLHQGGRHLLNTTLNRVAATTAAEVDLVLYLIDAESAWTERDATSLARLLQRSAAPFAVLASKSDAIKKTALAAGLASIERGLAELLAAMPELSARLLTSAPRQISAKRPEEVASLKTFIAAHMPTSAWLFPAEDLTDRSQNFICSEFIREQLFRQLGQEIPYGCAVKIDSFEARGDLVALRATVLVSRASHKGMVVGKGGQRIKEIGQAARQTLEQHLERQVFLDLQVAVAASWTDDARLIAELAHLSDAEALHI